jgi:hypothetical protein
MSKDKTINEYLKNILDIVKTSLSLCQSYLYVFIFKFVNRQSHI